MNTLLYRGTLVPACLVVLTSGPLEAAQYTWDGGGNDNWSSQNNWFSTVTSLNNKVPVNNGSSDLVFNGTSGLENTMNANWSINALSFSATGGNFIISGNSNNTTALTIKSGVTNSNAGTQTLDVNVALSAAQTWTTAGTLVIGSAGADRKLTNNGHTLTLDGAGNFLFNSQFTGSGGLVKNGSGTATLYYGQNTDSALNVYTGATTVNNGTLVADLGATDGSPLTPLTGTITVGGGPTAAKFESRWLNQISDNTTVNVLGNGTLQISATTYNSQLPTTGLQETIGNLNVSGGSLVQTVSGTGKTAGLVLNGNISHDGLGETAAVIAGNVSLGGSVKTVAVAGDGDLQITATVSNGGITKTGDGTLILSGNNTYDGATNLTGGTTVINGNQSAANGDVIVGEHATLAGTGTIGGDTTVFGTHAVGGDSAAGTQTFTGDLTYASGSIFSWNIDSGGSDTVSVNGALTFEDDVVFQIVLGDDVDLGSSFWSNPQTWSSIFTGFTSGVFAPSGIQVVDSGGDAVNTAGLGSFNIGSGGVTWAAVPEPTSALAGLLVILGLLRRRRA